MNIITILVIVKTIMVDTIRSGYCCHKVSLCREYQEIFSTTTAKKATRRSSKELSDSWGHTRSFQIDLDGKTVLQSSSLIETTLQIFLTPPMSHRLQRWRYFMPWRAKKQACLSLITIRLWNCYTCSWFLYPVWLPGWPSEEGGCCCHSMANLSLDRTTGRRIIRRLDLSRWWRKRWWAYFRRHWWWFSFRA